MRKIIVGVDSSDNGAVALRWAVAEAAHHDAEVVTVFAWSYLDQGHRPPDEPFDPEFGEDDARQILDDAIAAAGIGVEPTKLVVNDIAADAIIAAAGPDDLIVVGARGMGGFKGLLLGSVSQRVLELAPCAVAVIRDEESSFRTGEIVVGVDGSDHSRVALRWAATEARARGVGVRLVHAWQVPVYSSMAVPQVIAAIEDGATEMLAEMATDSSLEGIDVVWETMCGGAAESLLIHDSSASLIVVATRGRSLIKRALLGSTSRQVVHHATVPIVVVPAH